MLSGAKHLRVSCDPKDPRFCAALSTTRGGGRGFGVALLGGILCTVATGCIDALQPGVPIGGGIPTRPTPPAPTSSTGASGGTAVTGGATLVVQNETLSAVELWQDHLPELRESYDKLPPDQFTAYLRNKGAQLVTDRVSESLLYQQASLRMETRMTEAIERHVDSEIRKVVTARYDGVQRKYEKDLESQGRNLEQVQAGLRREFIVAGYLESEIKPKVVEPTRAALYAVYEENVTSWRKPARRSMSLIDVRTSEFLPAGVSEPTREQWANAGAEARTHVLAAKTMLAEGADFAAVARQYSHGLHAEEGGRWGWVSQDAVRERFLPAVAALENLQAGQVSDVVEAQDGFFLVRCDELEPGFDPDFESVQPELADRYFRVEFNRLIARYVEDVRKKKGPTPEELDRFHRGVVDAGYQLVRPGP